MRPRRRTTARIALCAVAALLASGCGITHLQDLNFRTDARLHFTGPKARSIVHQPFTVTWTMRDFTVAALRSGPASHDAGYYAVFVDQSPIKPGATMKAVGHGDPFCEHDPKCPDAAYLQQHLVFTTTQPRITLSAIPNLAGHKESPQLHTITVVLMDTSGHRIGESAWELDVRIPKAGY